jgi:NitT/TauT family transport system ATP-binding protein
MMVRGGPTICGREDVQELQLTFTSRAGAGHISLRGVSFSYPKNAAILRAVSLEVGSDEIAVVTGESGIGKTTLLKVAASLLKPAGGSVSCPPRIGFVFQDDRLLPWRSLSQNTALPLLYQGFQRKSALCFAQYLLSEAGLAGEEDKKPDELSGGMKKRAALARCFARLPDAIFLDEPFSGLHSKARGLLWDMFMRFHALHPVPTLIVTHYPEEISTLASCTLYVLEGKPGKIAAVQR